MSIRGPSRSTRRIWSSASRRCAPPGKLRPRALIGVDLFGQPADWPALSAIAAPEGLFTLDDLAQSFGASLHGAQLGTQAQATATSFFPSKPLGAYGDGGALFTESDERAALYRSLRTHGEGTTRYEVLRTGMNGRLDTHAGGGAAGQARRVRRGAGAAGARSRGIYDRRLGNVLDDAGAGGGQHQRLGDLRGAAAGRGGAGAGAGGAAGGGGADRDLLSAAAASAAGVCRPRMTGRRCRCRRTWRRGILALPIHPDL